MNEHKKTLITYQPLDGYCYNSDTLFLYDFVSSFQPQGKLLDIGSGSGILGLLIAQDFKKVELESVEKQEIFQFLTEKNSKINNIENRQHRVDFLDFETKKFLNYYSFIVSNPPFYHSNVVKSENKSLSISRYNEHLPIEVFFINVNNILKPRGYFIFCYDAKQLDSIFSALKKAKLTPETMQFLYSKKKKEASLVLIQARKNSNSLIKILPSLIMFDENNQYTEETKNIYRKVDTYTFKCKI